MEGQFGFNENVINQIFEYLSKRGKPTPRLQYRINPMGPIISSISAKAEGSRTYLIKLFSIKIHVSIRICYCINQYLHLKFFLH